jgi:hypothetical protein
MSQKPAIFNRNAQRNPLNLLDLMTDISERMARVEEKLDHLIDELTDPESDLPPGRDLQGDLLPREREQNQPL